MPALGFEIQPRDVALLTALFESRVMTAKHVDALFFNGSGHAVKKRLQILKKAGLISEQPRGVTTPAVLSLATPAFRLLKERGIFLRYPTLSGASLLKRTRVSELTIKHELEVMDVKAAFHSAIKVHPKFVIEEFSTWPLLNSFKAFRDKHERKEVPVLPDGFIEIHEPSELETLHRYMFLELDRSEESQTKFVPRAGAYRNFYKSGGFAVRRGGKPTEFKEYPFRVLIILKTVQRRNNTIELLLQMIPPILRLTLLTTFDEVVSNPFGPIWIRPGDYRNATVGTAFDPAIRPPMRLYKHQPEREQFVEQHVMKRGILEPDE